MAFLVSWMQWIIIFLVPYYYYYFLMVLFVVFWFSSRTYQIQFIWYCLKIIITIKNGMQAKQSSWSSVGRRGWIELSGERCQSTSTPFDWEVKTQWTLSPHNKPTIPRRAEKANVVHWLIFHFPLLAATMILKSTNFKFVILSTIKCVFFFSLFPVLFFFLFF